MSAGPSTGGSNASILPVYDKTPLSHLLEVAVQKTFHELHTMADMYVSFIFIIIYNSSFILVYRVKQI